MTVRRGFVMVRQGSATVRLGLTTKVGFCNGKAGFGDSEDGEAGFGDGGWVWRQ